MSRRRRGQRKRKRDPLRLRGIHGQPIAEAMRRFGHWLPQIHAAVTDGAALLRAVPAAVFEPFPYEARQLYAHWRGVYLFPTSELIEWLAAHIIQPAIEIGAGHGAVARALGIPATDSMMQRRPDVASIWAQAGQPPVRYGHDVIEMEAARAIAHYRPATVIGCWVTQRFDPERGDRRGVAQACAHGVDERAVLEQVQRYIFVGNRRPHGRKRILGRRHAEHRFPWIVSRGWPALDRIWVWTSARREDRPDGGGAIDRGRGYRDARPRGVDGE